MSVKGNECSELCGVRYVKPSVVHMKGDKALVYTQCMLAKRYMYVTFLIVITS